MEVKNPGLAFNKTVFKDLNPSNRIAYRNATKRVHEALFKLSLDTTNAELLNVKEMFEGDKRTLKQPTLSIAWPGLLIGLGYGHGAKTEADNKSHPLETEMKSGFYFDFTTGLPVLPGSTVKGILRSYFPGRYKIQKEKDGKVINRDLHDAVRARLEEILRSEFKEKGYQNRIDELENIIFEGKIGKDKDGCDIFLPSTQQDIFFDAYPCKGVSDAEVFIKNPPEKVPNSELFLGEDVLTPHRHPLKDPIPLKILKILPSVEMKFQFLLNDVGMSAADKEILFIKLLCEFGAGARKGVGFGQFEPSENNIQLASNGYISFQDLDTNEWFDDNNFKKAPIQPPPTDIKKPLEPIIIEDDTWLDPSSITKGTKIAGTVIFSKNGDVKVRLHIRGKKIIKPIGGKADEKSIVQFIATGTEGKPEKDNFNVSVKRIESLGL